jgi:preprotein translocase subunit SecF
MEFFKIRRTIPFMRHALVFNVISLVTFLIAVGFLATKGLHFSIEFTGGTVMEVTHEKAAQPDRIRESLGKAGFNDINVIKFGSSQDVLIRLPLKANPDPKIQNEEMQKQSAAAMEVLRSVDATAKLTRTEFVGGQVGKELATDGALALLVVCLGIMVYLAFRFEWRFAVATILANLHDVVIILGMFAAFQWEFSLPVLAAVLAILGYSVNESVVVFDRVRENFRKMRRASVDEIMDASITGTISRTIITHGSTQMMVLSMLVFGGPTLHYFAVALTIGILFGIYSSIFVAAGIAMWLGVKRDDLVKTQAKEHDPNDPNAGAVV